MMILFFYCIFLFRVVLAEPPAVLFDGSSVTATEWGRWKIKEGGLVLHKAQKVGRWNLWKPEAEANYITDGMIRAQVKIGKKPDFSLLGRIQLSNQNTDEFSGYGFSLERKRLAVYRWENGYARRLVKSEKLSFPSKVELELYFNGPNITGTVYDAKTMKTIASVTVKDSRWSEGEVAYRVHSRQDSTTALKYLSVDLEPAKEVHEPLYDIFGSKVLALVKGEDVAVIPKSWPIKTVQTTPGEFELLLPNRNWIPRLQRLGLNIVRTTGSLPYRVIDDDYRTSKREGLRIIPTGVDLRQSYKDHEMVADILRIYHKLYPDITALKKIGKTRSGRPIWALRVTDNPKKDENEPMLLFNAAHHGSELMATEFALDAMHYILSNAKTDAKVKKWTRALDLWFVPMVNPDGNYCFWNKDENVGRKNCWDVNQDGEVELREGVDLNRNYPFKWGALKEKGSRSWPLSYYYRGPSAGSEPETKAMMRLSEKYHPVAVISWHTSGSMILSPYTIDGVSNPEVDVPWAIAEELVDDLPVRHPTRKKMRVKRKMYSVDGTDQDWHYFTHGSIAYIIEGPIHNPKKKKLVEGSLDYMLPIFTRFVDRVYKGPRISGTVLSADGQPVDATVAIKEIKTNAAEEWRNRETDGRFDRMLSENGTYTLEVNASGYKPLTKTVKVDGVRNITIVLEESELEQ